MDHTGAISLISYTHGWPDVLLFAHTHAGNLFAGNSEAGHLCISAATAACRPAGLVCVQCATGVHFSYTVPCLHAVHARCTSAHTVLPLNP